jgi:hypothetical protein
MEEPMDRPMEKQHLDFDYDRCGRERDLEFEQRPDSAGYWFLAAVLFAFIAAGVIVYRAATDDFNAVSNDGPKVAQSSPIDPQTLGQTR